MRAALVLAIVGFASTADAAPNKPCVEQATINGLWICGPATEAPSHGGESFVMTAFYKLENRSAKPITVELLTLDILDPQDKPTRLTIDYANFLPKPVHVTKATIAPGAKHELVIFGKGSLRGLTYHIVYRHRVMFRADGVEFSVKASEMYFRYPHRSIPLGRRDPKP